MKVYIATQIRSDEEVERQRIIGVFSTREKALAAGDLLAEQSDALDYPDLFQVDAYDLDQALRGTAPERELSVANA